MSSCSDSESFQDALNEKDELVLSITERSPGPDADAQRGTSISFSFEVEAKEGIKSITLNEQEVSFNPDLSVQEVKHDYFIDEAFELGVHEVVIVLIDLEDNKVSINTTLNITE